MLPYRPALRFKQGEYNAAGRICPVMQQHIRPYFILPPIIERDPEKRRVLTDEEIAYVTGDRIGRHWPRLPAYMDTQYVMIDPDNAAIERIYQVARSRNPNLIAVITASDIANPVWRGLLLGTFPRAAIYVPAGDLDGKALRSGLQTIGLEASDCEIFIDFTGFVLDPDIATEVVSGKFDELSEIANWGCIVFQGSNFPTTNPAEAGSTHLVPRHEWIVFNSAMKTCSVPAERLGFSDFGADCGQINFPKKRGGVVPIPHVRYTTETSTVVVRGKANGKQSEVMKEVLKTLVARPDFAGKNFSYADRIMWNAANGIISTGTPSQWRENNMAHHITHVVRDLAVMSGIQFEEKIEQPESEQIELFSD